MATYGTDLVLVATGSDGESTIWVEFIGWDGGGAPSAETENFIQGTQSQSQTFGNPTTGKSVVFNAGSNIASSIPTGNVVMAWVFMGAATNMYSYASGGHRFGIGASLTNFDMWSIGGDDRSPNPYGGWWNVAVDPRATVDYTGGTGSGGAWQYFGSLIGDTTLGIRAKIAKGSPHAVDGMLRGRGEIYCTGTGATFTLMAAQNDLVANRWGCLQDTGGGTFLWKGLMSFGQTATSTTFSDSNKTIVIDSCPKTYAAFNKIEFKNASSSVTLINISFTAKGTLAKGNLEMIANCTAILTGCTFNNMGTFIFQSNATVTETIFNSCGLVTSGGGIFTGTKVLTSTVAADTSALVWNVATDTDGKLNNMTFSKGTNAHHAITLGALSLTTVTLRGITFTGFNAANAANDSVLLLADQGSDKAWTIYTVNCTGTVSYKKVRAGDTVTIVADPVTVSVNVKNSAEVPANIQDARVFIKASDGTGPFPFEDLVTIVNAFPTATVTHTGHGMATNDKVVISGASHEANNGIFTITVTGVNTYTYTITDSDPGSSPTGTIISTFVVISGLTNALGNISMSRVFSANQPIVGWVRKASDAGPYYKTGPIGGSVNSTTGFTANVQLISDD